MTHPPPTVSKGADPLEARAAALHRSALVWDNHGCLPFDDTALWLDDLHRYRQAGVDVAMINIGDSEVPLDKVIRMAACVRQYVAANPRHFVLATSIHAIRDAKAEGKLAIGLNVEGVFSIDDQLSLISLYYDIGVRWILMVYNRRNRAGYGVHDAEDKGLTAFGRSVVSEMDRVGMVKCCTHTGYRTALDVLHATDKPTIFSHSNPRALRDHPRNIPDRLIDACAATDGVVCINGVGIFLGDNDASPDRFVDHIDYIAQRVGIRHVGIGLDYVFDQTGMDALFAANEALWPVDFGYRPGIAFLAPEQLPDVTEELLKRGYSDEDACAVLGENLLRVAASIWK
jgi:membrane dipeptidase